MRCFCIKVSSHHNMGSVNVDIWVTVTWDLFMLTNNLFTLDQWEFHLFFSLHGISSHLKHLSLSLKPDA